MVVPCESMGPLPCPGNCKESEPQSYRDFRLTLKLPRLDCLSVSAESCHNAVKPQPRGRKTTKTANKARLAQGEVPYVK